MAAGQGQERRADDTDRNAETRPTEEIERGRGRVDAAHRLGADRAGDEEVDERRGDAVVEAALHVEEAANPRGHPRVPHDGGPERGVGRGDDGADGGGHPQPVAAEEERGSPGPGPDGERQADAEEPGRQRGVGPQGADVDPGGVGEEHQGEGDLRQRADRRRVQVDVDERGRPVRHDHPEEDEGDRGGHVPAFQARRDEAPDEDAGGDDGQRRDVEIVVHGPGAIVLGGRPSWSVPKVTTSAVHGGQALGRWSGGAARPAARAAGHGRVIPARVEVQGLNIAGRVLADH